MMGIGGLITNWLGEPHAMQSVSRERAKRTSQIGWVNDYADAKLTRRWSTDGEKK